MDQRNKEWSDIYFLGNYRRDVYDRIINSNIAALKETTNTLISKTTEGFDHCQHEVRVLAIGMPEELKEEGFGTTDELSREEKNYIRDFNRASISFISDPFSASEKDVVAFSYRAGSVILIGIYS